MNFFNKRSKMKVSTTSVLGWMDLPAVWRLLGGPGPGWVQCLGTKPQQLLPSGGRIMDLPMPERILPPKILHGERISGSLGPCLHAATLSWWEGPRWIRPSELGERNSWQCGHCWEDVGEVRLNTWSLSLSHHCQAMGKGITHWLPVVRSGVLRVWNYCLGTHP